MYKKLLLASVSLLIFVTGCSSFERTTFQTLSATKVTLDQAQVDYEAGTLIPHNKAAFTAITAAKLADVNAVDAMVTYEQLKATGATTSTLNQAQAVVVSALAVIPGDIVAIKALYNSTTGGK